SVPVTVWDPPAWVETLEADDDVLVVGRVRRRFFRTAAGTSGARTDVEAESVARARDRRRLAALMRRVDRELDRLDDTEGRRRARRRRALFGGGGRPKVCCGRGEIRPRPDEVAEAEDTL